MWSFLAMDSDYETMFNASGGETHVRLSNLPMGGMALSQLSTSEVELKLFPDATVCKSVENGKNLHVAVETCEDQDVFCYSDLQSGLFSVLSDAQDSSLLSSRALEPVSSFSSSEPLSSLRVSSSSDLSSPTSSHDNYSDRHTQPLSPAASKDASSVLSPDVSQSLEQEKRSEYPVTAKSTAESASEKHGCHLSDGESLAMECEDDTETTEAGDEQTSLVCSDDDGDGELAEKAADFQLPDNCELFSDSPSKSPAWAERQKRDDNRSTIQPTSGRREAVQRADKTQTLTDKTQTLTDKTQTLTDKTGQKKTLRAVSRKRHVATQQTSSADSFVLLNLSVMLHTHPKLHKCCVCKGCYHQTSKVELLQHSCVCTCDQKSIACRLCDMAFVWTCGLTKHMAFHDSVAAGTTFPWKRYSSYVTLKTKKRKIAHTASKQDSASKPQTVMFCCSASGCKMEFATARELVSHITQSHSVSHEDGLHGEPRATRFHPTSKTEARVIDRHHPFTAVKEEECLSHQPAIPSTSQPVTSPHVSAKSFSSACRSFNEKAVSSRPGPETQQFVGLRTCSDCGQQFDKVTAWRRHQKSSWHSDKRMSTMLALTYVCQKCGVACKRVEQLQQHYKIHHHAQCRACPASFSRHSQLVEHHSHQHCHACPQCGQVFTSPQYLHTHTHLAHPVTRLCGGCGLKVSGDQALAEHYCTTHSFPCSECHQVFRDSGELVNHCTMHRSLGFQCQVCQQVFRQLGQLAQHYLAQHAGTEEAAH